MGASLRKEMLMSDFLYIASIQRRPANEPCPLCGVVVNYQSYYAGAFAPVRRGWACFSCVEKINREIQSYVSVCRGHKIDPRRGYDLLAAADFACVGCNSIGPLQLDHDHRHCAGKTGCDGCVRFWLCVSCNGKLRSVQEDVEVLRASRQLRDRRLADYVEVFLYRAV